MIREAQIDKSLEKRINAYLRSFKSGKSTFNRPTAAGETALDEYLLERAAEELRAAKERVDRLKREMGNS